MSKMLFISNYPRKINNFVIPSLEASKNLGYEFHYAGNMKLFKDDEVKHNVILHNLDLVRFPFHPQNIKAYNQLNILLKNEQFDVIHCNTPIGGVLGRICGKKANVQKIIYTAHGFHFYEGAPLLERTLLKWLEMWMAHYTDAIITINHEDFQSANKFKLRNSGKVYYVPGVGVDTKKIKNVYVNKDELRKSLNIKYDDIVLIAMGDLIARKNYAASVKAVAKLHNKKLKLLICGEGPKLEMLQKLIIKTGTENQIQLLGYRNDINELLHISDIFIFTTYQEGLPRSMMEAMAAGLPVVCSKIRGNIDLIEGEKGGYLCMPDDIDGFAKAINVLADNYELRKKIGRNNMETVYEYDIGNIKTQILKIYSEILN